MSKKLEKVAELAADILYAHQLVLRYGSLS